MTGSRTRALEIVRDKTALVEEVKQNLPQFLVMHCESCDRDTRVNGLEITKEIDRSGDVPALVLKGSCKKCGKDIVENFGTLEERRRIALRTEKFWERQARRREKNKKVSSSKEKIVATKTKKTDKAEKSTTKASKKTEAKASTKKASKKTEAKASKKSDKKASKGESTRTAVYVRGEGKPTQQQAFIMVAGGAMRTVEEINKRWAQAAKKGLVGDRTRDVQTIDLTFMCSERAGKVEIDGKEYEMWMGRDPESGTIVFGSTHKDVLGKDGPIKVKNGKVGKIPVAKSRKDLPKD